MSAAAPLPPPGPSPVAVMSGHAANSVYSNGADGWSGNNGASGPPGPGAGSYPPIAEIVGSATETVESLRNHTVLMMERI